MITAGLRIGTQRGIKALKMGLSGKVCPLISVPHG